MLGFIATAFAPNIETAIFTCGSVAGSYNFNKRTYVDVFLRKLVLFITLISFERCVKECPDTSL